MEERRLLLSQTSAQVLPGEHLYLGPTMAEEAHLRLPPKGSRFLQCLWSSILGSKQDPPVSLGLVALQIPTQGAAPHRGDPVLAVSSLAVSSQGDNSFVVMTNFIVTPGQKQGTCPEVNTPAPFSGLSFRNSGELWWCHWGKTFSDIKKFSKSQSLAPYHCS